MTFKIFLSFMWNQNRFTTNKVISNMRISVYVSNNTSLYNPLSNQASLNAAW